MGHNKKNSKLFILWFVVLFILYCKSQWVLGTLFGIDETVFLLGSIAVIPILFLMSFSFLFPPKGMMVYLLCLDVFLSALFVADMVYARGFGHLISVYMMFARDAVSDMGPSVISLFKWTDAIMVLDLPIFVFLVVRMERKPRIRHSLILFLFAFVLGVSTVGWGFHMMEKENLLGDVNRRPILLSPIGDHMFDLYRFFYNRNYTLTADDIQTIDQWIADNQKYLPGDSEYGSLKGILKGKNVIVIQCESLENFVVHLAVRGQEVTPNINRLLKHSIYFDNIVEQVRDGNSSDAGLMYNTSLYPLESGSAFLRFAHNGYCSLPKLLNSEGYLSEAIHGDNKEFWNRNTMFPTLGYADYIDETRFKDKQVEGMGILDESLFSQSLSEIKKMRQPFDLVTITLTSHMPFDWPDNLATMKLPGNDESTKYLQCIHYLDTCIGQFVEGLDAAGYLDNTAIVIYGDHEGIHKYYDTDLPDNNRRIPFIVYIPGMDGVEIHKIGGQVDMMPTLAYLLGIDRAKYENAVLGRNLLGMYSGSGILADGRVLSGVDGAIHLSKAFNISDMYIRGDYYKNGH